MEFIFFRLDKFSSFCTSIQLTIPLHSAPEFAPLVECLAVTITVGGLGYVQANFKSCLSFKKKKVIFFLNESQYRLRPQLLCKFNQYMMLTLQKA